MQKNKKIIVVSAVGLRQGGTLTILRDCLEYLSTVAKCGSFRVIALVHDKKLAYFPEIEYIELPNVIKSWGRRLWCEYVTMGHICKRMPDVFLWLSLHDTTPYVKAERQALYCQTSFPFYDRSLRDFYFQYKIALFSLLTRFYYRINVHRNKYIIVQQKWFRDGLSKMLGVDKSKFIIAPPQILEHNVNAVNVELNCCTFLYPAAPDCHKNFEVLCEAARMLEKEVGIGKFKVVITLSGNENRYARWLYKKWGHVESICFSGYMSKNALYGYYNASDCLVFPSKVETWGLPISEFGVYGKPMILADRPYAHETACGCAKVAYFDAYRPDLLKNFMKDVLNRDFHAFVKENSVEKDKSIVRTWKELFDVLLSD